MIKLTRAQEEALIYYALDKLLNENFVIAEPKPKRAYRKHKWTKAQHEKFSVTMRKKWQERQRNAK